MDGVIKEFKYILTTFTLMLAVAVLPVGSFNREKSSTVVTPSDEQEGETIYMSPEEGMLNAFLNARLETSAGS